MNAKRLFVFTGLTNPVQDFSHCLSATVPPEQVSCLNWTIQAEYSRHLGSFFIELDNQQSVRDK